MRVGSVIKVVTGGDETPIFLSPESSQDTEPALLHQLINFQAEDSPAQKVRRLKACLKQTVYNEIISFYPQELHKKHLLVTL